ncbi:MAG: type I 3-dehydroquinate dehydratase [Candidatus Methanoperedens sp.]|nr:type I 3-dehydroquinate dehydratase [Candidatus Methanoperedens sp.]
MVCIGGLELNRTVIAAIGEDPVHSARKAKQLGADILELRIDLLSQNPLEILEELKKLEIPIIITNRMKDQGGSWNGSEEDRIRELLLLLPVADAVDIELCAHDRDMIVREARNIGKTVIISTHDFQRTPDNRVMNEIIKGSLEAGADIAKLAVMPGSLFDVLRLLEVTYSAKGQVCTIAMGALGNHSRIIAPLYGSLMTYGYVDTPTAPGQFRIDELKNMLKMF